MTDDKNKTKDNFNTKKSQDYFYYKSLLKTCNVLDDLDSKTIIYEDDEEVKNFLSNVDDVEILDKTFGDIPFLYSEKIKEKYDIGPFLMLRWNFVVNDNNEIVLRKRM